MKANTTITVLEAITKVNSVSKKSRIENTTLTIGNEVYKRDDGIFYENVIIENRNYRPFLELSTNEIHLDCVCNSKAKTIIIKKWK